MSTWAAVPGMALEVSKVGVVRTVASAHEPSRELPVRMLGGQWVVEFGGRVCAVQAIWALAWGPAVVPEAEPEAKAEELDEQIAEADEVLKDFVTTDEGVSWSKAEKAKDVDRDPKPEKAEPEKAEPKSEPAAKKVTPKKKG